MLGRGVLLCQTCPLCDGDSDNDEDDEMDDGLVSNRRTSWVAATLQTLHMATKTRTAELPDLPRVAPDSKASHIRMLDMLRTSPPVFWCGSCQKEGCRVSQIKSYFFQKSWRICRALSALSSTSKARDGATHTWLKLHIPGSCETAL